MDIQAYWEATLKQEADKMRPFFHTEAHIYWHNTDECFSVDEFLRANCEYPGKWDGEIERIEKNGDIITTVTHVYSIDEKTSFHAISFIQIRDDRIASIDEYWGEDGHAPQWRMDKHIGTSITGFCLHKGN